MSSEMNLQTVIEKLRVVSVNIGTSRTNAFSSDVPEYKMRCIVAIFLIGDGSGSRTVDIEKVEEDGSYTMKFPSVPIAPADFKPIPQSYDPLKPIMVLEGGTNLSFKANAGSPYATVVYWDK